MSATTQPSRLRAAVIQLTARQVVEDNLHRAEKLVRQAITQGAEFVVLPENFAYIGQLSHKVEIAEDISAPGPILTQMSALARETHCHLLLGGVPTKTPAPTRCYNTSVLLDPHGAIAATYRKIHLFDIQIPDGVVFQESAFVMAGQDIVTAPVVGLTVGLSICYDLRFPELYRALSQRGAEVCTVPAAFALHTGKDHWLPLLRARAIENQIYVLAAGQYGKHTDTRFTYGKSSIVDPWGAVIAQVSDGEGLAIADLDMGYLRTVREQLPCLRHRQLS